MFHTHRFGILFLMTTEFHRKIGDSVMSGQAWAAARTAAELGALRLLFAALPLCFFFEAPVAWRPAACGMSIIGSPTRRKHDCVRFWFTLTAAFSGAWKNVIIRLTTQGDPFSMLSLIVWAGAISSCPGGSVFIIEGFDAWKNSLGIPLPGLRFHLLPCWCRSQE
jgi:hypothetical protein